MSKSTHSPRQDEVFIKPTFKRWQVDLCLVFIASFLLGTASFIYISKLNFTLFEPLNILMFSLVSVAFLVVYVNQVETDTFLKEQKKFLHEGKQELHEKDQTIKSIVYELNCGLRMIHDLKQPLQALDMSISTLDQENEAVQSASSSIKRIIMMVGRFWDTGEVNGTESTLANTSEYPKMLTTSLANNKSFIYVRRWLLEIMPSLEMQARKRGVSLQLDITSNTIPTKIFESEVLITRVVANLVDNAIKNSKAGGTVEVKVFAIDFLLDLQISNVSVDRNPINFLEISEDNMETNIERNKLGLKIVKGFLHEIGGKICYYYSGFGRHQFDVILKFKNFGDKFSEMEDVECDGYKIMGNSVIHIIDDDEMVCRALVHQINRIIKPKRILTSSSFDVETESQMEGLPDLYIIDDELIGLRGVDILKRLKTNSKTSNIPVIACSGSNHKDTYQAYLNAGAFTFLYKPVNTSLLIESIREALIMKFTSNRV